MNALAHAAGSSIGIQVDGSAKFDLLRRTTAATTQGPQRRTGCRHHRSSRGPQPCFRCRSRDWRSGARSESLSPRPCSIGSDGTPSRFWIGERSSTRVHQPRAQRRGRRQRRSQLERPERTTRRYDLASRESAKCRKGDGLRTTAESGILGRGASKAGGAMWHQNKW